MDAAESEQSGAIRAWLGTSASQVFFMQLGFLCYEVGYVPSVWVPSVILKNVEDTFVGILAYIAFSHSLATSSPSLFGIISVPNQLLLINVDVADHSQVFISAVFATTCATIISGAVLERMKNKAYILYCFLIIFLNYSFVAHWVWNPEGWLHKMGFVDGAGAVVIHSTGGIAAAIAVWQLGPRQGIVGKDGKLKDIERARNPVMVAMGSLILWYGWFAFNIASPVASDIGIGSAIGTTGLVTCIAPTFSCCSALMLMYSRFAKLSYHNLLSALLSGLVAITGACYTCNVWEAALIGFFASPVYFLSAHVIRQKLGLDDPLQIITVHACCGVYSCVMEGILANDVMGTPGLIFGGYKHFGVQLLGVVAVVVFNIGCCSFIYMLLIQRCLCRKTELRVSVLDTYLGVTIFELNNNLALQEVLEAQSSLAKQMMWQFHHFTKARFNDEQFDFLVAVMTFRDYVHAHNDPVKAAKAAIAIIDSYVATDSVRCVNISNTKRQQLLRWREQLHSEVQSEVQSFERASVAVPQPPSKEIINISIELNANAKQAKHRHKNSRFAGSRSLLNLEVMESLFQESYNEVFVIVLPVFSQFLRAFDKKQDTMKISVKLPFQVSENWSIRWDEELQRRRRRWSSLAQAVDEMTDIDGARDGKEKHDEVESSGLCNFDNRSMADLNSLQLQPNKAQ